MKMAVRIYTVMSQTPTNSYQQCVQFCIDWKRRLQVYLLTFATYDCKYCPDVLFSVSLLSRFLLPGLILHIECNYSAPVGEQRIAISLSVCLSVCLCVCLSSSISLELLDRSAENFCADPCGCGSVLLGRRCDTLCTSGLMDDVTFGRSGPYGDHAMRGRLNL